MTAYLQGNCGQPPSAAAAPPLLPLKPRQCVVTVGDSALQFVGGKQWLDNVYFHLRRTRVNPAMTLLELGWNVPRTPQEKLADTPTVEVYLSNVTVQGAAKGQSSVITAMRGSKALAEGARPMQLLLYEVGKQPFPALRSVVHSHATVRCREGWHRFHATVMVWMKGRSLIRSHERWML